MNDNKYVSLFEYRGRPDFEKVGKLVYEYSKFRNVKTYTRNVPKKKIKVIIYPKWFLDEYFLIKRILKAPLNFFK